MTNKYEGVMQQTSRSAVFPSYWCPKHGDQGGVVGVELTVRAGPESELPESLRPRSSRRYCMACWVDMMDQFMCQLVEVPASPDAAKEGE